MAKKVVKVEKEEVKVTSVKKTIPVVKKKEETKKSEVTPEVKPKPVVKKKAKPKAEIKTKPISEPEVKKTSPPKVIRTFAPVVKEPEPIKEKTWVELEIIPEAAPEKKLVLPGIPQRLTDKLVKIKKALMEEKGK